MVFSSIKHLPKMTANGNKWCIFSNKFVSKGNHSVKWKLLNGSEQVFLYYRIAFKNNLEQLWLVCRT